MAGASLALAAYLLGSVSFGLLLAKRRGVDLRAVGSGNIGATNVRRALGAEAGRAVMVLDALKGLVPTLAARVALGPGDPWVAVAGVCAVLGHCYPLWHGGRGGKGAATTGGVLLAACPPAGVVMLATYLALKKLTGRASVGSLAGAALGALVTALALGEAPRTWMALALFALIVVRHRANLGRLVRGEEPRSG
ncbi:MAG: glycerol-3-phosphate 1-O-acyltransferase PlsY [Myxococcales bacterium]|nr:glycerol-3-phosphate 1-O-acyltransferase PlsY [Myxococcales bacterium]